MIRRLYSFGAVATASVALIAGCGGSSNPSTTPKTTTPKTTPAKTTPATTPASTGLSGLASEEAKGCLSEVATYGKIFGGTAMSDLETICKDYQAGNLSAAEAEEKPFCEAVASDSSLPSEVRTAISAECSKIPSS